MRSPKNSRSLAKSTLQLLVALSLSIGCGGFALADDTTASLERLENKFFQHTFPKDETTNRLDRIEKMVYGETKQGNDSVRLNNLVQSVPAGSASDDVADAPAAASSSAPKTKQSAPVQKEAPEQISDSSKYPAVTAMEQKLFGKDYANEPVQQRLARLETKKFGKASSSTDLVDRMDQLKNATGIDITKTAQGPDWDDDDDNNTFAPPTARKPQAPITYAPPGDDGTSFSGRDLRKDLNSAFGRKPVASSGGGDVDITSLRSNRLAPSDADVDITSLPGSKKSQGSSSSWSTGGGSGSYGFPRTASGWVPPTAPSFRSPGAADDDDDDIPLIASAGGRQNPLSTGGSAAPATMGLSQQVNALEVEIFGKASGGDLRTRLSRLEEAVFPKEKPSDDKPLPDRVARLVSVIPISAQNGNRRVANRPSDMDDLSGMPQAAPQRQGGLSKIINSMGRMMGGGYAGGFPVTGAYATDPSTGLLIDPNGNLIDPNTGMVIGRRVVQPNYGYSPYGGINSFQNGFSPYGMGGMGGMGGFGNGFGSGFGGTGFGIGGGGLRMGIGR